MQHHQVDVFRSYPGPAIGVLDRAGDADGVGRGGVVGVAGHGHTAHPGVDEPSPGAGALDGDGCRALTHPAFPRARPATTSSRIAPLIFVIGTQSQRDRGGGVLDLYGSLTRDDRHGAFLGERDGIWKGARAGVRMGHPEMPAPRRT